MIDYFSKWIEAKPLAKITSEVIRNFVLTDILSRHGIPYAIITDNGPQFVDNRFQEFCKNRGIRLKYTSVHHPQANEQVEAANKLIINLLKKKVENAKGKWVDVLPSVLWALRTTPNSSTGQTPFLLSHGSEAMLPIEIQVPTQRSCLAPSADADPQAFIKSNDAALLDSLDLVEELRSDAALRQEEVKRRIEKYYNSRVREKSFKPGDLVLRKVDAAARGASLGKLAATWEGPYIIAELAGIGAYRLQTHKGDMLPRTWNASDLKKFYP